MSIASPKLRDRLVREQLPYSRMDVQTIEARERLQEIAEILAAGLMRLRARKSSGLSTDLGESSLHFTAQQSGPDGPRSPEADA
jgi:hypothetical protein